MEKISIGEVGLILTFIVGFVTSVRYLRGCFQEWITKAIKETVQPLEEKLQEVDLENCKNYLVSYLADAEKGNWINELETQRFWEEYQHYEKGGGNSYIKQKVEKLKEEGKI